MGIRFGHFAPILGAAAVAAAISAAPIASAAPGAQAGTAPQQSCPAPGSVLSVWRRSVLAVAVKP